MKLERLNENQIRCTLSKSDLEQRELRLSELAFGSAKARELFHDMIQQAAVELGFEVDNIPLMIEAIPIPNECLILVVTKVENPEDLEHRFPRLSRLAEILSDENFLASLNDEDDIDDYMDTYADTGDDEILSLPGHAAEEDMDEDLDPLGLIAPLAHAIAEAKKQAAAKDQEQQEKKIQIRLFAFRQLDPIISLSAFLTPFYQGESSLYKDTAMSDYYLFLDRKDSDMEDFNRACTIASDYGTRLPISYASPAYCKEHFSLLFEGNALETLNQLNG